MTRRRFIAPDLHRFAIHWIGWDFCQTLITGINLNLTPQKKLIVNVGHGLNGAGHKTIGCYLPVEAHRAAQVSQHNHRPERQALNFCAAIVRRGI